MPKEIPQELVQEVKEFLEVLSTSVGAKPPDVSDEWIKKEIADWLPDSEDTDPEGGGTTSQVADEPEEVKPKPVKGDTEVSNKKEKPEPKPAAPAAAPAAAPQQPPPKAG